MVELIDTGSNNNWDAHGNMQDHRPKALRVDRAIAALIKDLKARGLFDSTLVAICTEFGRTPWTDSTGTQGRNHYAKAFTALLAGGGVKGGCTFGQTDEFGANIVDEPRARARLSRDDLAPDGHRPHPAGLSLRRPRLPADRRGRECDQGDLELDAGAYLLRSKWSRSSRTMVVSFSFSFSPASISFRPASIDCLIRPICIC